MEVTKSNFEEILPEIKEAIKNASFLCVDGEFTGLRDEDIAHTTPFDTPSQCYEKLRNGALDFLFVQFGLAAFEWDSDSSRFSCKVYNFFIFPRPLNRNAPDQRFLCQSSSMEFLTLNGFDFNKLFRDGIPYLSQTNEEILRKTMEDKRKYLSANRRSSSPVHIPQNVETQVEEIYASISNLLSSDSEEEYTSDKATAYVRRLVYKLAKERLGEKVIIETKDGKLVARKRDGPVPTEEEIDQAAEEKDNKDIDTAIGFSKVIRAIVESNKLIVGHNMLLDVCHMIHQFCNPLPENYIEFKEMAHHFFPHVIDTKTMCSFGPLSNVIRSSFLENLFQQTAEKPLWRPEIEGEKGYIYDLDNAKHHEAGYDAFITGICFISMFNFLKKKEKTLAEEIMEQGELDDEVDLSMSKILKPYMNKLFIMKNNDVHIFLGGEDSKPQRDHVFFMSFPKTWNNTNISQLFSSYGGAQIHWLNDTSAWIALREKKEASKVKSHLVDKCRGPLPHGVVVRTYAQHANHLASSKTSKRKNSPIHETGLSNIGEGSKKRRLGTSAKSKANKKHPKPENGKGHQLSEKKIEGTKCDDVFPVDDSWG